VSATRLEERIMPQEGPQEIFLGSDADIAIFGGSAGSGKSYALLLEAMRYPSLVPGFDSVMFRRNTTDLRRPGGLWSESEKLYYHAKGIPTNHRLEWRWPGKGSVKLSHLEHESDVFAWHGAQIGLICFDELTTFLKSQFFYLLSRNRSTTPVRPYVRASCNADAGSWVAELIAWWIDQETGYYIPERSGVVRYFIRGADDNLEWFDTKREAMKASGRTSEMIKSLTFIGAKLTDNPALMRNDPGYLGNLMMLAAVERERLLQGNWKIRPSAGLYFNRAWVQVVDIAPVMLRTVRGWDLAATLPTPDTDPDWTACTKLGHTVQGHYIVLDHKWMRGTPSDVERYILNTSSQDGYETTVALPEDPGQAGKHQSLAYTRLLAGYPLDISRETGDKVTRFGPFSAQCQQGNVLVLRGDWNEHFFTMLESFPEYPHDDSVDATSRGFQVIAADNMAAWMKL
jgi:predicted phage terminase large subunit-like protein